MTAHELARVLLNGPNLPVHFAYNYGDYWRSQVAPEVTEVDEGSVVHSAYHQLDKVVSEDEEDEEDDNDDDTGEEDEQTRRVILLS